MYCIQPAEQPRKMCYARIRQPFTAHRPTAAVSRLASPPGVVSRARGTVVPGVVRIDRERRAEMLDRLSEMLSPRERDAPVVLRVGVVRPNASAAS